MRPKHGALLLMALVLAMAPAALGTTWYVNRAEREQQQQLHAAQQLRARLSGVLPRRVIPS